MIYKQGSFNPSSNDLGLDESPEKKQSPSDLPPKPYEHPFSNPSAEQNVMEGIQTRTDLLGTDGTNFD